MVQRRDRSSVSRLWIWRIRSAWRELLGVMRRLSGVYWPRKSRSSRAFNFIQGRRQGSAARYRGAKMASVSPQAEMAVER